MRIVFEAIKLIYYLITLGIGILYFRGDDLFSPERADQVLRLVLPLYLLFTGIMIGYVAYELLGNDERQMSSYLVGGSILGIVLVVLSVTVGLGGFEIPA